MKFGLLLLTLIMSTPNMNSSQTIYEIPVTDIDGNEMTLEPFRGQVMLIVNVASKCGLTPQYEDLQKLYQEFKDDGLVVIGFPSNDFMGQEPGSAEEIKEFCTSNYGVTFPMFSKIKVKGKDIHPLYQFLTREDVNGKADSEVAWNFQKYLISREGELIELISPRQSVLDEEIIQLIREQF